jgi:hypothetical protein
MTRSYTIVPSRFSEYGSQMPMTPESSEWLESLNALLRLRGPTEKTRSGASGGPIPEEYIAQATTIYKTIEIGNATDRKRRLLFANAVELCVSAVKSEAPRVTKKSIALKQIATSLGVEQQRVVDIDTEGNRYLTCMKFGGAGSLNSFDGAKTR